MPSETEIERLCVVLVRARNPSNIGAVARAMHDFGFARLRVVNQYSVPFEAARSAVDASAVLAEATTHACVADAVADCTLVVGTTAVGDRHLHHELLALSAASPRLREELLRAGEPTGRVALLFGSEKTGLSNEELSHCHWLLTIPMHQPDGARHLSMNLGQAVAVCLYELVRGEAEAPLAGRPPEAEAFPSDGATQAKLAGPVAAEAMERLTAQLLEVLAVTGYTRRHASNSDPAQVRRLVRRIGADAVDAPVWMGILRQVLWKLGCEPTSTAAPDE
jgi:TrmH family RNA methyltransferase